jgi:hypothetical protein
MNQEIKKKWLIALKSDKYEKGKHFLFKDNKYCCLGVLCDIYAIEYKLDNTQIKLLSNDNENKILSSEVVCWSGLNEKNPSLYFPNLTSIAEINDNSETFEEVIKIIEEKF